jgi:RNA polymerase sigma-70 factor (ECF subfamily)
MDLDLHQPEISAGDPDAFARWVAGAESPLRDSLRPFAARVDVESVLQEALLRVWQVAPRFQADGRPNGLLRLALRIARNLALSEARRLGRAGRGGSLGSAGRGGEAPLFGELPDLADPRAGEEPDPLLRRHLADCREKLPGKPASALAARLESGGEPDSELAVRLGMKLNTFLQNFTRARKLLAECLERRGVRLEAFL